MGFEELKKKQGVMWGAGPYIPITEVTAEVHDRLTEALVPAEGKRWLDVATGTGAVALRAARAGAQVTGLDLAPALIETAGKLAADEGLDITYDVGDAEALPYEDGSFDVVSSAIGTMFAPDHAAVARELERVTKPGGRIGLANWTPDSGVAGMFKVMKPYQPPPPEGVGVPFEWGRRDHVEELLGDAFDLQMSDELMHLRAESGKAVWDLFVTAYGPTKTLAESLEPERRQELQRDFAAFFEGFRTEGGIKAPYNYLLALGTRR